MSPIMPGVIPTQTMRQWISASSGIQYLFKISKTTRPLFSNAGYLRVPHSSEGSPGPPNIVMVQGVAETEPEQKFNLHITCANGSPPSFSAKCPNEPPMAL